MAVKRKPNANGISQTIKYNDTDEFGVATVQLISTITRNKLIR